MIRKNVAARTYEVVKEFVFRGLKYKPGDPFDPIKAQCAPAKLVNLIRQRYLGDDGPSLAKVIKEAQLPSSVIETPTEGNSDADWGDVDTATIDQTEAPKPARRLRRS